MQFFFPFTWEQSLHSSAVITQATGRLGFFLNNNAQEEYKDRVP